MSKPISLCINKSRSAFFVFRQCKGRKKWLEIKLIKLIEQKNFLLIIYQLKIRQLKKADRILFSTSFIPLTKNLCLLLVDGNHLFNFQVL